MSPEEIHEVNQRLHEELNAAKDASGYTEYWNKRNAEQLRGGLAFTAYLKNLRYRAEKAGES